jgi:hypothetical protein
MTHREIMILVLSEVTGKPKDIVREMFESMIAVRPEMRATLDEQMPEAEAQELLTNLRAEKAGILNWLLEGREKALKRLGETQ